MDDPSWREQGPWTVALGALWLIREMLPRLFKSDDEQRKITPADVFDEVRKIGMNQVRLEQLFEDFKSEGSRVNDRMLMDVREALRLRNNNGGGKG